jgi:chromosome segregation ATPase
MPRTSSLKDKPLTISFYEKNIVPQLASLDKGFAEMRHDMDDRFDFLFKKFEDFRQEFLVIHHQLNRMDQRLDRIEGILQKHTTQLKYLFDELKDLKITLTQLEKQQAKLSGEIHHKKASWRNGGPSNQEIQEELVRIKEEILKLDERVDELESQIPKP